MEIAWIHLRTFKTSHFLKESISRRMVIVEEQRY